MNNYKLALKVNDEYKFLDLPSNFTVAFNYQLKDFEKPSDIKTGFSKSVSILDTPNNNIIFTNVFNLGSIYRYYNPIKKTPYILSFNGMKVSSGYAILDKIERKASSVKYSLTLYDDATEMLHNIKFSESGETRKLNELNFGFDDELETFDYDIHYTLDAWSKFGYLTSPNNQTYQSGLTKNSIKSLITPIYLNTGLYDDFDSNKFLVGSFDNSGSWTQNDPHIYNPNTKAYSTETAPILNESKTVKGKVKNDSNEEIEVDFTPYKGWSLFETERELHPAEANQVLVNRLPLGVELGKTWDVIADTFDIDDSVVSDNVHSALDNTYLMLDNIQPVSNINNSVINIQDSVIFSNSIASDVNNNTGKFMFFWSSPKFGNVKKHSVSLNNNIHCKIKPRLLSTSFDDRDNLNSAWFGEFGYSETGIKLTFKQTYNSNVNWQGDRNPKPAYDRMLCYNITLYKVRHYTDIYRNGQFYTTKNHKTTIYAVCGDRHKVTSSSKNDVETLKNLIRKYVPQIVEELFPAYFTSPYNGTINTEYLFTNWEKNKANKTVNEYITKDIDFFSIGEVDVEGEKESFIEVSTTSFTNTIPLVDEVLYNDGTEKLIYTQGVVYTPNYSGVSGYANPINTSGDELYSQKSLTTLDKNEFDWTMIDCAVFKSNTDFVSVKSEFKTGGGGGFGFNNYQIRSLRSPMRLNGCYLIKPSVESFASTAFERLNVDSLVTISEYSGSENFSYPTISKDLLNNINVGDLFLNICKMLNINVSTEEQGDRNRLKLLFNNNLYLDGYVDISDDVDYNSISISPTVIKSSLYQYSFERTESYIDKITNNRTPDYNIRKINYNYDVSSNPIDYKIDFKVALPYRLSSVWFNPDTLSNIDGTLYKSKVLIPPTKGSNFKQTLFYKSINGLETQEISNGGMLYVNPAGVDFTQYKQEPEEKLCLFDSDLKTVDFSNLLVNCGGVRTNDFPLLVTQDIPATQQINNKPCYLYIPRKGNTTNPCDIIWDTDLSLKKPHQDIYYELLSTPVFSNYARFETYDYDEVDLSFSSLNTNQYNLFDLFFYNYQNLIFNENNKLVKCKVRFKTKNINIILRSVYKFDNSYFVINKLNNFDFGKEFCEVEFIQIDLNELKRESGNNVNRIPAKPMNLQTPEIEITRKPNGEIIIPNRYNKYDKLDIPVYQNPIDSTISDGVIKLP